MTLSSEVLTEKPSESFYYGWIIVWVAFVTLGITFGIWYSYSVFILAVIKEFGWSVASASSIFSIFLLTHAVIGMAAGYLQDRFGPQFVVPAGAVILAAGLFFTSRSQNLWQFQAAYGVLGGTGVALLGFVSHSAFLPKWFERKRGLALGLAMAGIGLGMLIMVPLAQKIISTHGWRNAYLVFAGMILFVVGPLNLLLGRKNPESVHQFSDGDSSDGTARNQNTPWKMVIMDPDWASKDWDLKIASRTFRFWCLMAAFFFISFAFQGVLLHSVAAMVDASMSKSLAAFFFGLAGIMGSVGKIIFGTLSDTLGRERSKFIADAIALIGIICLACIALSSGPMAVIFALCFGIGYGAAAPLIPAVTADIFMGSHFGLIFAIIGIGGGIGGAAGTYISGLLRDLTGGYSIPFSLSCLSLILSSVFIWIAAPGKVRKMKKQV
ncbi:MAG: MFS transporter [Desulfobacteraceae bacterium]|nr:MFS transporter [Desulfobacteraceae bacterium]MBU4001630.1 MFS transporter [Pseudomonadota bacterium]